MPPRPHTAYAAPVRAKRPCMICFRNVILNYDPMTGELPVFRCYFATAATGKCTLCAARRKACLLPAEGMQGDSLDLEALLEWVTFYFDIARDADGNPDLDADGDEVYEHDTGFRAEICGAVLRLCTAFEATEKTHRSGLETTGAKKKRSRANYPAWVAARRALMQVYHPRPAGNAKKAIECRLVPGDDGYQLWALAKRMFRGEVSAAVTSALGPAQEAVDMATFPLRLDDF
ncbi:hypothetical protein DL764_010173 [Monosporascus ibericus]|uniref:Uncharacterized protein n=1 Tax=Monosporascus ibericus TaxID=155417 RepID=A0A4Q4ST98_9PEZI|nr:hypothetical protein DL764_010173 [Monosporascus ibericus]